MQEQRSLVAEAVLKDAKQERVGGNAFRDCACADNFPERLLPNYCLGQLD